MYQLVWLQGMKPLADAPRHEASAVNIHFDCEDCYAHHRRVRSLEGLELRGASEYMPVHAIVYPNLLVIFEEGHDSTGRKFVRLDTDPERL